jgi:hypothetical protein
MPKKEEKADKSQARTASVKPIYIYTAGRFVQLPHFGFAMDTANEPTEIAPELPILSATPLLINSQEPSGGYILASATGEGTSNPTQAWSFVANNLDKISNLEKYGYQFDNKSEVTAYLLYNPGLIAMLEEVPEKVLSYLPSSKFFLNIETDPEIINDERLYVWVSPSDEPDTAYDKFMQFKQDWWFKNSNEVRGKLFVALDYR